MEWSIFLSAEQVQGTLKQQCKVVQADSHTSMPLTQRLDLLCLVRERQQLWVRQSHQRTSQSAHLVHILTKDSKKPAERPADGDEA
jgi:hypothetical protein